MIMRNESVEVDIVFYLNPRFVIHCTCFTFVSRLRIEAGLFIACHSTVSDV